MSRKLTIDLIFSEMKIQNISGLVALNLNGKNINDISILSQIPTLEIISLNNNDINNLSAFKNLKNLKKLSLKGNKINDFNQIDFLRYCPKLEYLKLKENPIEKDKNYYKIILDKLPKLKIFDDFETNKINIIENKMNNQDNKNIDEINNEAKYIKLKMSKNKNNFNSYNQNPYLGSPMKLVNLKKNNNNINQQQIYKKSSKEKIVPNNDNMNNNKIMKDNNEAAKQKDNEEDDFEIININDEKKKIEKENKRYQKIEQKPKADISGYSFKKKSSTGYFFYDPKKRKLKNKADSNISLENINLNKEFLNSFNEEHKNMPYNYSTSKYNRKIIGGIHSNNNALSQSIRYDDGDEENNKNGIYSTKNKLAGIKSRLLNNISNKIYNKTNNLNNNDKESKEIEKEKTIIQSIKLLITNLDKEELNQLNNCLTNIIQSKSKK